MALTGYTKLFSSIVTSTIWRTSKETKIVFVTMLALADRNGVVEGSIPGLADVARVTIQECETALQELSQPDKYSRSQEHDGRRIEAVQGGWILLNHRKYRDKLGADERREYLRRKKAESRARRQQSVNNGQQKSTLSTHTDTDTDTKATTEVRTEEVSTYRTRDNNFQSSDRRTDGGGELIVDRRFTERRQTNGAFEPGSLPRDHNQHRICRLQHDAHRFCITYSQYDKLAARYQGDSPEITEQAITKFITHVSSQLAADKVAGDMIWLLKHFDVWMIETGRVPEVPKAKKQKQELDLAAIEREINEEKAAKAARARERR